MTSMYHPIHEKRGRPKGSQNRSSKAIREALEDLVTMSLPKMKQWIDDIAADDPKEAMKLILDMSEYVLPKLARMEHVGDAENPIQKRVVIEFVNADTVEKLPAPQQAIDVMPVYEDSDTIEA